MLWAKLKENWISIACAVAILCFIGLMIFDNQDTTQPAANQSRQYVGSVNSDKYHYPDCRWAQNIYEENEIWFPGSEEAEASGYVPCQTCDP